MRFKKFKEIIKREFPWVDKVEKEGRWYIIRYASMIRKRIPLEVKEQMYDRLFKRIEELGFEWMLGDYAVYVRKKR